MAPYCLSLNPTRITIHFNKPAPHFYRMPFNLNRVCLSEQNFPTPEQFYFSPAHSFPFRLHRTVFHLHRILFICTGFLTSAFFSLHFHSIFIFHAEIFLVSMNHPTPVFIELRLISYWCRATEDRSVDKMS